MEGNFGCYISLCWFAI